MLKQNTLQIDVAQLRASLAFERSDTFAWCDMTVDEPTQSTTEQCGLVCGSTLTPLESCNSAMYLAACQTCSIEPCEALRIAHIRCRTMDVNIDISELTCGHHV
eukprot:sb/3478030/